MGDQPTILSLMQEDPDAADNLGSIRVDIYIYYRRKHKEVVTDNVSGGCRAR